MATCQTIDIASDRAFHDNLRLSQLEYQQRHVYLYSHPRCLGVVLGNACNIDCIHCYQSKNGDNLLRPKGIARELRRELMGFYPYLNTMRMQGGEVLAIRGFADLVEDVALSVDRPILSISTNGTLITEEWAERLVRTPFSNITVSIDGGTRATYNRLRRGADLDDVLANVDRIQRWKRKLQRDMPFIDSFFVVMRSNFREIPQYLDLMHRHGMIDVALQTMEVTSDNLSRTPALEADEAIVERSEIEELYAILRDALPRYRNCFRMIRLSGLQTLFEQNDLDASFLQEGEKSLYPDSDGLAQGSFELCPNPWTTLFVVENGDVHLCFISEPVGNLYAEPLPAIWNSPRALAKRSDMIAGRYLSSGCSRQYCGWREGQASEATNETAHLQEWRDLVQLLPEQQVESPLAESLSLVRNLMAAERRKRGELESLKVYLESALATGRTELARLEAELASSESLLENGQAHIDHLELKIEKALSDFHDLHAAFQEYRKPRLVRMAHKLSKAFAWLRGVQ